MNKWLILGIIAIIAIVIIVVFIMTNKKDTDKTDKTDKTDNTTNTSAENFTLDEIVVPTTTPVHVDTNNDQYGNPSVNANETEQGTIQDLPETYPFRSQIQFDNYPSNHQAWIQCQK